jgi:hypothetical protein
VRPHILVSAAFPNSTISWRWSLQHMTLWGDISYSKHNSNKWLLMEAKDSSREFWL